MHRAGNGAVLLTGANGYLGSLITAGLLSQGHSRIVAPIRAGNSRENLIEKIKVELAIDGLAGEVDFERLVTVELPSIGTMHELLPIFKEQQVNEIIHCAGCVDYFDSARLKEANIDLTNELITLGKQQDVKRFVYLSTAFSSGYVKGIVREELHTSPESDPTEYTQSKREAEALVSNSSLPFLIVRPSVVIGDSRDGHYAGKPYGLYQLWGAFEKFLCDRYRSILHFIAPRVKLQVIHQDAFQDSFMAAYRYLPDNSIIHLTSKYETLPTALEIALLWAQTCTPSSEVRCYDRFSDVTLDEIDRRMKVWLEFTAVNNDIAAYPWQFQTTALDTLRANGLKFQDATIDTIRICQDRFIAQSERIQTFLAKSEQQQAESLQVRESETAPALH